MLFVAFYNHLVYRCSSSSYVLHAQKFMFVWAVVVGCCVRRYTHIIFICMCVAAIFKSPRSNYLFVVEHLLSWLWPLLSCYDSNTLYICAFVCTPLFQFVIAWMKKRRSIRCMRAQEPTKDNIIIAIGVYKRYKLEYCVLKIHNR